MKFKKFRWLHFPTGATGWSYFTDAHAIEAHQIRGFSVIASDGIPEVHALLLVNKWNAQRDWKYWLQ